MINLDIEARALVEKCQGASSGILASPYIVFGEMPNWSFLTFRSEADVIAFRNKMIWECDKIQKFYKEERRCQQTKS
jgi:hypothetical protein